MKDQSIDVVQTASLLEQIFMAPSKETRLERIAFQEATHTVCQSNCTGVCR